MTPSTYSDLQLRIGAFLIGGFLCLLVITALALRTTLEGDARTAAETSELEEEPLVARMPVADPAP